MIGDAEVADATIVRVTHHHWQAYAICTEPEADGLVKLVVSWPIPRAANADLTQG
jgi:hypothetical protein